MTAYATTSIGHQGAPLSSPNFAEENAYFGWPLLILGATIMVWQWRNRLIRACAIVGIVCLAFSLGPIVKVHGVSTGVLGPWALFKPLPLLDSMNVARFTFVTVVALGVMLAVATDRIMTAPAVSSANGGNQPMRLVWTATVAAALVPLVPLPLPAIDRTPVPRFFTAGTYHEYVAPNHTMVPIPPVSPSDNVSALGWQTVARMDFRLPEGYFMGPIPPDNMAGYSPPSGPTTTLIQQVRKSGKAATVTEEQRMAILAELRRWQADAVVIFLDESLPQMRETLDPLFGPAKKIEDVWLWDVRPLTGG